MSSKDVLLEVRKTEISVYQIYHFFLAPPGLGPYELCLQLSPQEYNSTVPETEPMLNNCFFKKINT